MTDFRKYRTKSVRVGAFEWHPELMTGKHSPFVPDWFMGALHNKYLHRLYGQIVIVGDGLQVNTNSGTAMAKPGDWVVYWSGSDNHLSVHSGEEFGRLFEENEDRRPRLRSTNEKP